MMNDLGTRILNLRKERNMSQEELATKLSVTRQAISKWERNEGLPDLYNVKRISEVFCVSIDELLDHQKEEVEVRKKNSLAFYLLTIPMSLITLAHMILIFTSVIFFVVLIGNMFQTDALMIGINMQLIFVPLALVFSSVFVDQWIRLLNNQENKRYRFVLSILFGVMIIVSFIVLIYEQFEGFALILTFIMVLIILILGQIGSILEQEPREISLLKSHWFIRLKKYINIFTLTYLVILSLALFKNYVLVKPISYINHLEINNQSDNFYMSFNHGQTNITKIDHFNVDLSFSMELEDVKSKVYIEFYLDGTTFFKGEMVQDSLNPSLYKIIIKDDSYQLPLISTERFMNVRRGQYMDAMITYEGETLGHVVTISLAVESHQYGYTTSHVWIWDHKNV